MKKRKLNEIQELEEYLVKNGSGLFTIHDYVTKKVEQTMWWWIKAWAITVVLALIIICTK